MAKETIYKSLLDCWTPPQITTDPDINTSPAPIAFITTTFTFDSEFFDDECLTRFLTMETERENDGAAFLIEREEKLAGLHGGIVLVDQFNCKGERSLRWDLVACRVKNGIMHAKISILHWSNCIRMIIGSANLTQNGYCLNQEIFGVIDYFPGADADLKIINDTLIYLQGIVNEQCGTVVKRRYTKQQTEIRSALRKWNINQKEYRRDEVGVQALFVSSSEKDVLKRLKDIFRTWSASPPNQIFITSPFFDTTELPNAPSHKIFEILNQRGEVEVIYNVTTEPLNETSDELIVNAPSFLKATAHQKNKQVSFRQVNEEGLNEENKKVPRPLHMKSIWLANEDVQLYMIGSSNFTSAALGLFHRTNYEANLVYVVSKERNPKAYTLLEESYLQTNELDESLLKFRERINEDEASDDNEYLPLPLCFGEAVISKLELQFMLQLSFNAADLPAGFEINYIENNSTKKISTCIYNEKQWKLDEAKTKVSVEWNHGTIPDSLLVKWNHSNGNAFWPVIIDSQITLPPVEALRNLPLEALLQILSSSQPLHRLLEMINKIKNKNRKSAEDDTIIDPHKLVNTTGFLLQRTRRVSYAMRALRERLEKPVFTRESLYWRLYGPIGVNAMVEAIKNEAKTEEEKQFLLAELALELSRVQPQVTEISVKREVIRAGIKELIQKLAPDFKINTSNTAIEYYSEKAIQNALNEL